MHNGAMDLDPTHPREIGKRLTLLRQLSGEPTQASFARSIGITPQALNNYERGVGRPEFTVALKIVLRCGVTLDYLYRGETGGLTQVTLNQIAQAGLTAPDTLPASRRPQAR